MEVGTAETILKSRTLNVAFWCYLKQCFGSWNCWEHFDFIMTQFESMFWKWELLRKCWKRKRQMGHFNTICNDVLEVETGKKKMKARTLNCAFWRNLKQCFGSLNCWENVESEDANWGILALVVTMVLFTLQLLRKLYKQRC